MYEYIYMLLLYDLYVPGTWYLVCIYVLVYTMYVPGMHV